jgi:hypothetical protein
MEQIEKAVTARTVNSERDTLREEGKVIGGQMEENKRTGASLLISTPKTRLTCAWTKSAPSCLRHLSQNLSSEALWT